MEDSGTTFGSFKTMVLIILAIALICLGVWIGFKIKKKQDTPPPPHHHTPVPAPPHPGPSPSPSPSPGPTPSPNPARNFNPSLSLISALYNPAAKEINVSYQVDSDTPVPPTRTYSVQFKVVINNKPVSSISEDEPLDQGSIGFPKEALLMTTGIGNNLTANQLKVQAQIQYHEVGSPASGVIGSPQTISVS